MQTSSILFADLELLYSENLTNRTTTFATQQHQLWGEGHVCSILWSRADQPM